MRVAALPALFVEPVDAGDGKLTKVFALALFSCRGTLFEELSRRTQLSPCSPLRVALVSLSHRLRPSPPRRYGSSFALAVHLFATQQTARPQYHRAAFERYAMLLGGVPFPVIGDVRWVTPGFEITKVLGHCAAAEKHTWRSDDDIGSASVVHRAYWRRHALCGHPSV